MIAYRCRKCREFLESPDSRVGQLEACPICRKRRHVPTQSQADDEEKKAGEKEAARQKRKRKRELLQRLGIGLVPYRFVVAGITHLNSDGTDRQKYIRRCRPGMSVRLVREPNNPHDKNAVAIFARFLFSTAQVGYARREEAEIYAPLMDNGVKHEATIVDIEPFETREGLSILGLTIDVEWSY